MKTLVLAIVATFSLAVMAEEAKKPEAAAAAPATTKEAKPAPTAAPAQSATTQPKAQKY